MRFGGLVAAVVVAAIAAIVVLRMSGDDSAKQQVATSKAVNEVKAINIYAAAQVIPVGSTITQEMLVAQPWPEHLALESFVKVGQGANPLVGMVARAPFQQGEPMIGSKLANPNDPNFIAGDLPAGMRVVTVAVNEVDGVAGFVFPGDHVDVIFSHDIDRVVSNGSDSALANNVSQKERVSLSETLLANVKVVAVDQRSSSVGAVDNKGNLVIPKSVSLMVSQADAQKIRLAQKTGLVSLSLRALADHESSDALTVTEQKDISQDKLSAAVQSSYASGDVKILRGAPKVLREQDASGASLNRSAPLAGAAPLVNPGLVTAQ